MLSFGAFPDVPLAQAREKRDDARKLVAAGTDPAQKRKEDKVEATISAGNTFEVLAQEYIAKIERPNRRYPRMNGCSLTSPPR